MKNQREMRTYLILPFLFAALRMWGQADGETYLTTSGETRFFSETPVENINAINKKSQVILNTATGEIAVRIPIRDFVFPNKLMQEHFNENYMESDKFPVATFSGKISLFPDISRPSRYAVNAQGKLTIHGVTTERELTGDLMVKDGKITLLSSFDVPLTDHKIEVPKLVFVKIAEVIVVKAEYLLTPRKK